MNATPFVSVIIPTRNRPAALADCLHSLTTQDYPRDRFEVIVVNDGGRRIDGPGTGSDRLANLECIDVTHRGPAAARNAGAERARGDLLAFIDDDCTADPRWLVAMVDTLARHRSAAVGGRVINRLHDNRYARASQLLITHLYRYYHEQRRGLLPFFTTNCLATSTETFAQVGAFDATFPFASEDRDWCDRCLAGGRPLVYAPDAVVHHAHPLTLGSFFQQHFRYGEGARRFHRARASRRGTGVRLEAFPFYSGMVRAPFEAGDPEAARVAILIMASQVAGAVGWALSGMRAR